MALPVTDIEDYPIELTGHLDENGQLPANILAVQTGSTPTLTMCRTPMRSLLAMDAALHADTGLRLRVTSSADSYRPLSVQKAIFSQRYTTQQIAGEPSKVCGGKRYWLKPGNATAACPGTSNHGLGLACDFVLDNAGRILAWLVKNAHRFGFSAELQSEPWHWHYFAGDNIPAATLAYEQGDDMTPAQAAQLSACQTILDGMARGLDEVWITTSPYPDKDGKLSLAPFWDTLATKVAEKIPAGSAADVAVLRAAVRAELDATKLGKL